MMHSNAFQRGTACNNPHSDQQSPGHQRLQQGSMSLVDSRCAALQGKVGFLQALVLVNAMLLLSMSVMQARV